MANSLCNSWKSGAMSGVVNTLVGAARVEVFGVGVLGNVSSLRAQTSVSDGVGECYKWGELANGSVSSAGVFDADDFTATPSSTPTSYQAFLLQMKAGSHAARLMACFDTVAGLPFSPTGNPVTIVWSGSGIFALVG